MHVVSYYVSQSRSKQGLFIVWDFWQLLLKPEKCKVCDEWMKVFKEYDEGHEILERRCDCEK